MNEKTARKAYLVKLNRVVDLAREILGGRWMYHESLIKEWHQGLTELGKITNLKQVKQVEELGWEIGDALGNYGNLEDVGNALVHLAEHYYSRFPIDDLDLRRADENIEELERIVAERKRA